MDFKNADKLLRFDHSNESYWAEISCGEVYIVIKDGSNFDSVDETPRWVQSDDKHLEVISSGTVCYAVEVSSNFWVYWCKSYDVTKWNLFTCIFALYHLFLSILQQGIITLITSGNEKDTLTLKQCSEVRTWSVIF